jgi:hypothetical protein
MFDEADRETGFALFLVIALAIVVSLATIGIATGTVIGNVGKKPAAATTSRAPVAAAAIDDRRARLYFELGSAELPGDATANAELAKQRAMAVRDLLTTAGVAPERIELGKPALTTGGADPREARRVDVTLN